MRRSWWALAPLALFLVACQAEPTPAPTPTATLVPIVVPTAIPSPTATAAPTRTPSLPPTPTPGASPTPTKAGPGPAIIPPSFGTYANQTFGFQLRYPPDWKLQETGEARPAVRIEGPAEGSPAVNVHVLYNAEIVRPDAVVDQILPQFLRLPSFRVLKEEDLTLTDGSAAFQTDYQWRGSEGNVLGSILGVGRASQSLLLVAEAPEAGFTKYQEQIAALLRSFTWQEPAPLGISRREALTLYFNEGPLILDPAIAQESQSIEYLAQVYSGLVSFGPDLSLVPELATWAISPDGRTFTFTIRENARFHDGRAVTAEDVRFSWERVADPQTGSDTVKTYLEDIVGVKEKLEGKAKTIAGVEVVDQRTLRVTIDAPKAYFLSKLAQPVAYVVDKNNVAQGKPGQPWWLKPNGTGPFRLRTWQRELLLVLEANTAYYKTPPKVPYVVFRLYGGIPRIMYETGEIDVAQIYAEELPQVTDPKSPLAREFVVNPELSVYYVGLSADQPPFDDPQVRRAFLLAADRTQVIRRVIGPSWEVAQGFLPPGLPGYNAALKPIAFDVQEAKRLLAQSKYGGVSGLPAIIYTTTGLGAPSDLVAGLLDQWKTNLGVDVRVRLVDSATYYYGLKQRRDNIYDYGWIADYPDPHNFLDVLFHSKAENNVGRYKSAEVDALLEKARVEQDTQARLKLYRQAEQLLVADAAAIPLYFGRSHLVVKPYVNGIRFTPFGIMDLRTVSLEARR